MDEEDSTSDAFIKSVMNIFPWSEMHGVFSSDKIPEKLKQEKYFTIICNLSRSGTAGSHFVALIRRDSTILYLDPLALYIELNQDISNFIESCNTAETVKMQQPIQHPDSHYCAYFCLLLSLHFNPKVSIDGIEKFSSENLKLNDCICINNIAKYMEQN